VVDDQAADGHGSLSLAVARPSRIAASRNRSPEIRFSPRCSGSGGKGRQLEIVAGRGRARALVELLRVAEVLAHLVEHASQLPAALVELLRRLHGRCGRGGELGVVREDRVLDPPELRAGLEAELVDVDPPGRPVRLERVCLPAAPVEREHQLAPEPLAERAFVDRVLELGDDLPMLAERERGLEPLLERVDPQIFEAVGLGAQPPDLGQPLERRAAPERERAVSEVGGRPRVALAACGARPDEQALEDNGVRRRADDGVAVAAADDRRLAESRAQPGDVVLDGVSRGGGHVGPPELVDQRVHGDMAPAPKREEREQRVALRAGHVDGPAVDADLEGTEDSDFEPIREREHGARIAHRPGRVIGAPTKGRFRFAAIPRRTAAGTARAVPTEPPVFGRSPSNRPPGSITIRFMAGGSVLALDAAADARGRTRSPLTLSALGKAAEAVPMVLLVTLVPRLLGPGPYGRVALAVSIVTLGSAALSVGGPMLLTRFVPAAEPTGRPALARALAVRLAWLRALTLTGVAGVAAVLGVARPDVFHPFELVLVVGALWLDVA